MEITKADTAEAASDTNEAQLLVLFFDEQREKATEFTAAKLLSL